MAVDAIECYGFPKSILAQVSPSGKIAVAPDRAFIAIIAVLSPL
jgi:hypothetical protein